MLDPLYLLATIGGDLVGLRLAGARVALLVFATNFPSRFYWTGGSFLRWDWLFYLVAGDLLPAARTGRCWAGRRWRYATLAARVPRASCSSGRLLGLG